MTNETFTQAEIDEYRSFIEDQMSGYFTDAQLIEMMVGDEPEMTNKTNTFPKLTAAQERAWQLVLDWHDEYVQHASDPAEYFIASGGNRGTINYRVIPGSEATFKALVKAGMLVKNEHPHDNAWGHYSIHPDFVPEYFDDEPATPAPEPAPAAAPAPVNNAPIEPEAKFKVGDTVTPLFGGWQGCICKVAEVWVDMFGITRFSIQDVLERRGVVSYKESELELYQSDESSHINELEARVKELETDMERLAASELELVQQNALLNSVVDRLGERAATLETENAELKARLAENHIQTAEERAADWGKWNKGN